MTKLLGFIDIIAGLLILASFYHLDFPRGMAIAFGICLILKGIVFIMNFFSLIDIAAGVLLVFALTSSVPAFILVALAAFLGLKGLASLISF